MTPFFDTHTHLTENDLDPAAYLAKAEAAGVAELLFCASNRADAERCADFAAASEHIYFAAGVHPHDSLKMEGTFADYRKFAERPRLIAIGEIGLDYFYDLSPRDVQLKTLQGFLDIARDMDLPAIIHCRDLADADRAYADAFSLLEPFAEKGGRFVLHAFAGSPAWLDRFAGIGAWFGVGGMVTFKRADNIREVVSMMPRDRVMLETDSPYLAPVPHRGEPNHPAFLPHTAAALAQLYGMDLDGISALTTGNAHRFFRLMKKEESLQ